MEYVLLAAISAFAGVMRGITGFGAAVIMAPAFSLVINTRRAVGLTIVLNTLMLVQLFVPALRKASWRLVIPMTIGGILLYPVGVYYLTRIDPIALRRVIGLLAAGAAVLPFLGVKWGFRYHPVASLAVGAITGFLIGFSGAGGPLVPLYVLSGDAPAAAKRANVIVFIGLVQAAGLPTLAGAHVLNASIWWTALLLLPVSVLATYVGVRIFQRIDGPTFERIGMGSIVVVGLAAALT